MIITFSLKKNGLGDMNTSIITIYLIFGACRRYIYTIISSHMLEALHPKSFKLRNEKILDTQKIFFTCI